MQKRLSSDLKDDGDALGGRRPGLDRGGHADSGTEKPLAPVLRALADRNAWLGSLIGSHRKILTSLSSPAAGGTEVNTVRTHIRNILRKLAVTRRNEAVRRARALSLLPA